VADVCCLLGNRVYGREAQRSRSWRGRIGLRLVLILAIAAVLRSTSLHEFLAQIQQSAGSSKLLAWSGVTLCVLGFGLAISARWHLGRDWGMPMTRKEEPELITSGPYASIRHPIYTGLTGAVRGLHAANRGARAAAISQRLNK
jgi:protein-S-isoprenylcysteine O-methyltransferase Ste14